MPTTTFAESTVAAGFLGYFDLATNSALRYWQADRSVWSGYVTGTAATMTCGGGGPNPFWVSVDGGAESNPAIAGGVIQLFTGLSDTAHFVQVRSDPGYVPVYAQSNRTGTFLSVTGAAPAIALMPCWMLADPSYPGVHSYPVQAAPGAPQTPAFGLIDTTAPGSFSGATIFDAQCSELFAWSGAIGGNLWYSIDGAAPVLVSGFPTIQRTWHRITGLDNAAVHRYIVWDDNNSSGHSLMGIMVRGTFSALAAPVPAHADLWGDSIANGANYSGQYNGHTDWLTVAARLKVLGASRGVGGRTTPQLTAALPSEAAVIPSAKQYAILAIGRNDTAGATFRSNYLACINALLTAGYTKVICRGMTPYAGEAAISADISTVVTTLANPNVTFEDTALWVPIDEPTVPHPSIAGYGQLAAFELPQFSHYFVPSAFTASRAETLAATDSSNAAIYVPPSAGIVDAMSAGDSCGAVLYAPFTPTIFRLRFPAFANASLYPDAQIQFYMDFGYKMLNADRWGNVLEQGIGLWTAHFLSVDRSAALQGPNSIPGQVVGLLTSASVDKVSYGRDVSSVLEEGAGHWNLSTFGLMLLRFARMMGAGPIQVGAGGWWGITDPAAYLPLSASAYANGPGWPGVINGPW